VGFSEENTYRTTSLRFQISANYAAHARRQNESTQDALALEWVGRALSSRHKISDPVDLSNQRGLDKVLMTAEGKHETGVFKAAMTFHDDIATVATLILYANISAKRWSEPYKQEIISSRVDATKIIADFCAELGKDSPVLFNANGVGIYGIQEKQSNGLPEAINETKAIDETALDSFLQQVGWEWEQATTDATAKGVRVVLMRFGMVLGKSGGALAKMLLPFKLGLGGTIGTGTQPLSWIDLNDLCAAIDFLIPKKEVEGPVDFVSPNCVTQKQFAKALAKSLHRPCLLPIPGFAIKLLVGDEMATELLLEGQHVKPARLLELGFQFEYPDAGLCFW